VQLKTKTKLFAAVDNDAREAAPNTLISHICLGMPGALPVLNEKAVELAARAAFALQTEPQTFSKFDRKHYFYPDLPLGYQITQFDQPIVLGGKVVAVIDGKQHEFGVARAHLEADAGKSTHPTGSDYSLVDLNRAGTPLLEIVSEPCMHSAVEAKAYASELYLLMKYADVSDVNLFYGNMRFDVNVSVSKDAGSLGTRTETKNLNSFRSVHDAVVYEINRQIDVLESGEKVVQETRGWQDDTGTTFSQRSKEDAHDYRYFPDPDIPPVVLDSTFIAAIEASMPTMPQSLRDSFHAAGLDASQIETIIDEPQCSTLLLYIQDAHGNDTARVIGNWLGGPILKLVADGVFGWPAVTAAATGLVELAKMQSEGAISSSVAKELFAEVLNGASPLEVAKAKNLLQVSDESELDAIVAEVLAANAKAAEDVRAGEMKAIGFLVGQVMKASGGKANPGVVQQIIKRHLGVS
jgi:aspartyl-tRNA(Asn)/glutamyl-tRNA(Gln) amidotransferase subunit B